MRILKLNDPSLRAVLNMPELKGKKPIGRGMFSAVFEGSRPDTVYKLTVDSVAYWMLNCSAAGLEGRHFATLIKDFGDVTEVRVGRERHPVFLYEVEKLKSLPRKSSNARVQAKAIQDRLTVNSGRTEDIRARIEDVQKTVDWLPNSLKSALAALGEFVRYYDNSILDMHMANFMQRSNGDLVINDPLFDGAVYLDFVRHPFA